MHGLLAAVAWNPVGLSSKEKRIEIELAQIERVVTAVSRLDF
jgi:hypothetical protein